MKRAQEQAIDEYLRSKGINPQPNPGEAAGEGDRLIDGVRAEYKTISGVRNPNPETISGAISNRAMNARSQAPNVVIDARSQPGMTREIAVKGISRAFGADNAQAIIDGVDPKIESVRVIFKDSTGQDVDVLVPRKH